MINAIRYTEYLEEAGFSKEQAKTSVKIWTDFVNDNLATKYDISEMRHDMKDMETSIRSDMKDMGSDMKEMESSIRSDMKDMESSIRSDMKDMETSIRSDVKSLEHAMNGLAPKITIGLGTLMIALVGALAVLIKI